MSIADIIARLHSYNVDATLIEDIVRLIVRPSYDLPKAYAAKLLYDKEYRRNHKKKVSYDAVAQESLPHTPSKNTTASLSSSKLTEDQDSGCARQVEEFLDAYNVCAKELGWTVARKLTKPRRVAIKRCISDAGDLEKAFDYLNDFANSKHASEFGAGQNDREWVVGIDYVIRASKWLEIMEGKFNGVQSQGQGFSGNGTGLGRH